MGVNQVLIWTSLHYCGAYGMLLPNNPAVFPVNSFVGLVNPMLTNDFGDNTLGKIKSDRADAIKIVCPVLALSVRSLYEAQVCRKLQMESLRLLLYIVCL